MVSDISLIGYRVIFFAAGAVVEAPSGHQEMIRQPSRARVMSTLDSPTKTGAPTEILLRLARVGEVAMRITTRANKIYFPCMTSNFKTLMINIMTFFTYSA
jgi:hypothetical protein